MPAPADEVASPGPDPGREPLGGLGLVLATMGVDGPPSWERLATSARQAEESGASAIWVTDHLFWHLDVLDCLTALTVVAQQTTTAAIGTAVLQLPLRTTASVAKSAAALQDLSGGRLLLGLGAGRHRREYAAARLPAEDRGGRLDDAIVELRNHWTGLGAHRRYRLLPQPSSIPVWVGGSSPAAQRRAGRLGDAWFPLALGPEDVAAGARVVAASAEAAGRSAAEVAIASLLFVSVDDDEHEASRRGADWLGRFFQVPAGVAARMLVSGSARDCAAEIGAHRAAGARHVCVVVADDEPADQFARLAAVATT